MSRLGAALFLGPRNVFRGEKRTKLLAFALAMVAALIVLILSVTQGLQQRLNDVAAAVMFGHVNVQGARKRHHEEVQAILVDSLKARSALEAVAPSGTRIVERSIWVGTLSGPRGQIRARLQGVHMEDEEALARLLEPVSDDEASGIAGLNEPATLALFEGQARALGVAAGELVTVRLWDERGRIAAEDYRVAAVLKDLGLLGAENVFVHRSSLEKLVGMPEGATGGLHLFLPSAATAVAVADQVALALEREGFHLSRIAASAAEQRARFINEPWVGARVTLTTWQHELSRVQWIALIFRAIAMAILLIVAFTLTGGLVNSIIIAVQDRTAEIGALRAMGMSRFGIALMFLSETALLSGLSATLGSVGGFVLAWAIDAARLGIAMPSLRAVFMSERLHLSPQISHLVTSILVVVSLSVFATLWPSWRAARIPPVRAMKPR